MEAMRESWTDDRMDDLSAKVDRIDADVRGLRMEMKTEFAAVRGEMDERFDKMEERFGKGFEKMEVRFERSEIRSDERFERLEERFDQRLDSLNHVLILFSGGVCAALITALAALIATQL
jgi:hypothetical protein